jgi:hypothetical protein
MAGGGTPRLDHDRGSCLHVGGYPSDGTAEQAIADLRLPYPADKETIRYVRAAISPQIQEILRTEWGGLSEISNLTTGQLTARRLDGAGETLLRSVQMSRDRRCSAIAAWSWVLSRPGTALQPRSRVYCWWCAGDAAGGRDDACA